MKLKTLNKIRIKEDNFFPLNRYKTGFNFGLQCLSEQNGFNDDLAIKLESYLDDNKIYSDQFNVEYMGYLTGFVKVDDINKIIPLINSFLKTL